MKKKMLYVHVLPVDTVAANAVQVLKMCQAFSNSGIDVTLAVPEGDKRKSEGDYKLSIEKNVGTYPEFSIVTFKQYTIFGRLKLLGGYFSVKNLLDEIRPDFVFLRNIVLVRAAIKTNTPFIYESHNNLMHNTSRILNAYWTRYMLRVSPNPLMINFVAISSALGNFWTDMGIPEDKVLSVHDGFDSQWFEQLVNKEDARELVGLPQEKKIVLYMGSLYQDRDIDNIIDMAKNLEEAYFVVVGGSPEEQNFYQCIAQNNKVSNIIFWGSVNHQDVANFLFSADILLMTWSRRVKTINYCSPLKLFEYMAAGRIIVGHGYPTIKEVLQNGEDAYLVDPDSKEDLLEMLRRAINENPEEFGIKSREKAFEKYTWQQRADKIIKSTFGGGCSI